jgi:hypothetical protein
MALLVTLVVRNTFFHFSQDEDDLESHGRSSSAPPTCRQGNCNKGDDESAIVSTSCGNFELDASASTVDDSDFDDSVSQSNTEHEDVSPPMTTCESDSDDDIEAFPCHDAAPPHLSSEAAQQQLDQMSDTVMGIWSKLRSIESSMEAEVQSPVEAVTEQSPPTPGPAAAGQQLSGKAPLFVPYSCNTSEVHTLLASVKQALLCAPGVASVDVKLGPAGTLSTISIRLDSSTPNSMKVQSVIAASKAALLESAANSQSVYVLGYEADPFQEDGTGSGFATALATMPTAWECTACWDTYSIGVCPRRKTCKWQHPGRKELQPVRVIVS